MSDWLFKKIDLFKQKNGLNKLQTQRGFKTEETRTSDKSGELTQNVVARWYRPPEIIL